MYKKLCIMLVVALSLFSQGGKGKIGTSSGLLLVQPTDPRGVALNGTHGSSIIGLNSLQYNPAGLSLLPELGVVFNTVSYFADISMNDFSFGIPFETSAIAIRFKALNSGSSPVTTTLQPEGNGETWEWTSSVIGVSWAQRFTERVQFGATLNFMNEGVKDVSGSAISVDMGLQYISGNVMFGLALKNIGSDVTFLSRETAGENIGGSDSRTPYDIRLQSFGLPTVFDMSLNYRYDVDKENNILFVSRYTNSNASLDEYAAGFEYVYSEMVYLRASYLAQEEQELTSFSGFAYGVGLNFSLGEQSSINFSYASRLSSSQSAFDASNYFGISLLF